MTDTEDSIDELAEEVEQLIAENKETLEKFDGVFDPKYRRMEEAQVAENTNAMELFS